MQFIITPQVAKSHNVKILYLSLVLHILALVSPIFKVLNSLQGGTLPCGGFVVVINIIYSPSVVCTSLPPDSIKWQSLGPTTHQITLTGLVIRTSKYEPWWQRFRSFPGCCFEVVVDVVNSSHSVHSNLPSIRKQHGSTQTAHDRICWLRYICDCEHIRQNRYILKN